MASIIIVRRTVGEEIPSGMEDERARGRILGKDVIRVHRLGRSRAQSKSPETGHHRVDERCELAASSHCEPVKGLPIRKAPS